MSEADYIMAELARLRAAVEKAVCASCNGHRKILTGYGERDWRWCEDCDGLGRVKVK